MSPLGARWASVFRIAAVIVLVALLGVAANRRQGEPRAFDAFDARELAPSRGRDVTADAFARARETPRDEIVVVRASDAKEDGDEDDDDDDDDASARVRGRERAHAVGKKNWDAAKTTEADDEDEEGKEEKDGDKAEKENVKRSEAHVGDDVDVLAPVRCTCSGTLVNRGRITILV